MTGDSDIQAQLLALRRAELPVTADEVLASTERSMVAGPVAAEGGKRRLLRGVGSRNRRTRLSFPVVLGWAALVIVVTVASIAIGAIRVGSGPAGHSTGAPPPPPSSLESSVLKSVTSVPMSVYEAVGLPSEITNIPGATRMHEPPLTSEGKPEVLYVWASYCPFCAAENWALVMALSKFGTFEHVGTTYSSTSDFAPDTLTLDLYKSSYSSPYLEFVQYDVASNRPAKPSSSCNVNGYACLQTEPGNVNTLFSSVGNSSFPFLDLGNKLYQSGAGFGKEPLALAALSAGQIAEQLYNSKSAPARAEVGEANYFVSAICKMTGNQPASVCAGAVVPKK